MALDVGNADIASVYLSSVAPNTGAAFLQARAATVTAQTDVNVLMLQRKDFDALLGPLQQLLDAQAATYHTSPAKSGPAAAITKVTTASGLKGTAKVPQRWILSSKCMQPSNMPQAACLKRSCADVSGTIPCINP